MNLRTCAVGALALLLLCGCGSAPLNTSQPDVGISEGQAAALADGTVTKDEYEASFQRFSACMSAAGFEVTVGDEVNATIQYSIPNEAVESGIDMTCYAKEFMQVDGAWQVAHEDTSPTADIYRECLIRNGITPAETLKEMVAQIDAAGIDRAVCAEG